MGKWLGDLKGNGYNILISLIFFVIAMIAYYESGLYTNRVGAAVASDLILDHIPVINLSFLYLYGYTLVIAVLFLYPLLFQIKRFHIIVSQFSLLVLLRSFFISLTHLKTPANAIVINAPHIYHLLVFNNDLFFSGHTAITFLGFLMFRKQKIGIFFLIATVILASTVLLMHVHYSIDIFAAFFITYGSYKLGKFFLSLQYKKQNNRQH